MNISKAGQEANDDRFLLSKRFQILIFDRYFDNSHKSYISRVQTFASATEQAISRV